jgi:hypothetical protein
VRSLDDYRLDVDEAMSMAQIERAAEQERHRTINIWEGIRGEIERGAGPFAEMLIAFRQDAVKAMSDLVWADPNDVSRIAALQADVQRSLRAMEHIDEFRSGARAAIANSDTSEDDLPPTTIEDD